jgi:hypothetical protein
MLNRGLSGTQKTLTLTSQGFVFVGERGFDFRANQTYIIDGFSQCGKNASHSVLPKATARTVGPSWCRRLQRKPAHRQGVAGVC